MLTRRFVWIAAGVAIAIPALVLAWWLGSPLFLNTVVQEELPVAASDSSPAPPSRGAPEAEGETMESDSGMAQPDGEMVATESGVQMADREMEQTGDRMSKSAEETSKGDDGAAGTGDSMAGDDPAMVEDAGMAGVDGGDEMAGAVRVKTGSLRDADSFHKGSGQTIIYRLPDGSYLLRLEEIDVTNGPDLHVYLSPHPDPQARADIESTGYIDLGSLKGNIGSQNYPIPAGVDVLAQMSVIIYCQPFHVVFSVAPLQAAG